MVKKADDSGFVSPEEKIHREIDRVIGDVPFEMKKTRDNLEFIEKVFKKPVPVGAVKTRVFGVETLDVSQILKLNIWNRSIYTVDMLDKMIAKMTLEQLKKYLAKKRKLGFDLWWLIILLIVGGIAILLIVLFLLPQLGNIRLW